MEREWENQRKDPDDVFFMSGSQAGNQRTNQGINRKAWTPAPRGAARRSVKKNEWSVHKLLFGSGL